ncbi:MAG: GNAT family N-acetyltransferase [Actinomycetia bacterium]|nr:GNAT family N-acetyltransferase [Actinomycetes bacterium]
MITIKHIKDFDLKLIETLCELEIENLGNEASVNQWVIPVLIRYGMVSIAEKLPEQEIVGVCQVFRSYDDPSGAFIHSFYIRSGLRGKKIGKLLLGRVINKLKSDDLKKVHLTADPENIPAAALYSSFGFKRSGIRKDEYGKGVDRDLYVLAL